MISKTILGIVLILIVIYYYGINIGLLCGAGLALSQCDQEQLKDYNHGGGDLDTDDPPIIPPRDYSIYEQMLADCLGLPASLIDIIIQYAETFGLKQWVDINKLNWGMLSLNPKAIRLLEAKPKLIDWPFLSKNPNAIKLLEENQDKIDFYWLSKNPAIFDERIL